ncbi:MAG TPA: aminotransferase class III-fold pyridoxal phosphate-dependent enzyme, partial [Pirellulaceae bacterium]
MSTPGPTDANRFTRSGAAYRRACEVIPGGVNSPARAFGAVGGSPLFIDRAQGAWIHDIDGNAYIDYVGSWGPMILGHAHPDVLAAIHEAADFGTSFGAPTERESELAELIIEAVPSVEMVRLVNSGTEATMSAIRLARGATGRDRVIKFAGHYHGHVDSLLVAAGSAGATLGVPDSPGVTRGTASDTLILPFNDASRIRKVLRSHGDSVAAVIVEPIAGNMGCIPPLADFLQVVRDETHRCGSVLIFDEVMT